MASLDFAGEGVGAGAAGDKDMSSASGSDVREETKGERSHVTSPSTREFKGVVSRCVYRKCDEDDHPVGSNVWHGVEKDGVKPLKCGKVIQALKNAETGMPEYECIFADVGGYSRLTLTKEEVGVAAERWNDHSESAKLERVFVVMGPKPNTEAEMASFTTKVARKKKARKNVVWYDGPDEVGISSNALTLQCAEVRDSIVHVGMCMGAVYELGDDVVYTVVWDDGSVSPWVDRADLEQMKDMFQANYPTTSASAFRLKPVRVVM